jgi:hypothetical protein
MISFDGCFEHLTFHDGEVHGLVGQGAEAAVGDEADVHAGVLERGLAFMNQFGPEFTNKTRVK